MRRKFKCVHCGQWHYKNPRLKGNQRYCGDKACQQARKNAWEREKLQKDPSYKTHRQASQKKSYTKRRGDKYQSDYRKTHKDYTDKNRERQSQRNQKRKCSTMTGSKIVNTDTLSSEYLSSQGFYALYPLKTTDPKKIVNTDALIVELVAVGGIGEISLSDSS